MAGIGHNGGPDLTEEYIDQRHALQIAIRDCPDLSPRAKFAGLVITTFMDQKGQGASPAYRLIAKITGYGVNEIKKLGDTLSAAFLIKRKKVGGKRGMVYNTALAYERAIEIYCRGQRNAYMVSQQKPVVSPSGSDSNSNNMSENGLVSPSRSDTNDNGASDATVVSPKSPVVSLSEPVVSLSGSDRRKKIEDSYPTANGKGNGATLQNGVCHSDLPIMSSKDWGDELNANRTDGAEDIWFDENVGTLRISDAYREVVRGEGFSDAHINTALNTAAKHVNPEWPPTKLKSHLLAYCQYAKDKDAEHNPRSKKAPSQETAYRDKWGRESF